MARFPEVDDVVGKHSPTVRAVIGQRASPIAQMLESSPSSAAHRFFHCVKFATLYSKFYKEGQYFAALTRNRLAHALGVKFTTSE